MKSPARLLGLLLLPLTLAAAAELAPPKLAVPYGTNAAAGKFAELNGIKLYYESYGTGPVMLQIHGNGLSLGSMGHQIQFFSTQYRVIAADSRGHGQSGLGPGRLTCEQQAADLNSLLDKLQLKSVNVLGWSDGGIIGLLLAIHHPDKVAKLAIMGANLNPEGAFDWARQWIGTQDKIVDEMLAKGDPSQPWAAMKQQLNLLTQQPHIPVADLEIISVPVLVMAGDKDVIRPEHTQQIFDHLPSAHLAIFPGATHMIPWDNHELFNRTVAQFFAEPYTRPDTKDIFK